MHSTLAKGEGYATVEFKVNLTRPISLKTGVSEATLRDGSGKLLALGTETCSIFPVANLAVR